jgi:hypothetical protein
MSDKIEKRKDNQVSTPREIILELQQYLVDRADGVNIVKGRVTDLFPLKHTFADSIYVRQMSMQQNSFLVGAIHKHTHVWFLLSGHITVVTEDSVEEFIAPCYTVSKPGSKRVIFANVDSVFVNVHKNPDNTQDINTLDKQIVCDTWEEYNEYIKNK